MLNFFEDTFLLKQICFRIFMKDGYYQTTLITYKVIKTDYSTTKIK